MNPYYIKLRTLGRQIGFNRLMVKFTGFRHRLRQRRHVRDYERTRPEQVSVRNGIYQFTMLVRDKNHYGLLKESHEGYVAKWLFDRVKTGDVVWDIGGNQGFYSIPLAKAVGDSGSVIAFEPMPLYRELICKNARLNNIDNLRVMEYALGQESASMDLHCGGIGAHTLVSGNKDGKGACQLVEVRKADDLRISSNLETPNVIKIDVEGVEEEVLIGLKETASFPECRSIILEIHFALLEAKGSPDAPNRIERLLKSYGFLNCRWIDRSHLCADRM